VERDVEVPARGREGIHSAAVFRCLLRHERNRSARDGSRFTLVVFDVSAMNSNGRDARRLASRIRAKLRTIDEVGWIDAGCIGVLLPATGIEGGRMFAQRVGEDVPCTVYGYPEHWLPGSDDADDADDPPGVGGDAVASLFRQAIPVWKSFLDVAGALVMLAVLSPLFLVIAAYIKVVSPGKVFYRQRRVGYGGRLFTFMKFRTMHENNEAGIHREYLKDLIRTGRPMEKLDGACDPRIIPGGRILRKACIDELPQLFNVLKREMSLVGPRPCIPYEAEEYLRWHAHRFDVLPGMTGLWQVSGKNKLSFEQMIRLDIAYMNRLSPGQDLRILVLTVPAIVAMVAEAVAKKLSGGRAGDEPAGASGSVTVEAMQKEPVANA
jgi:lipopolysaccharide/colanic/teichoic acid biosynthesis glycosyltransferase